MTTLVKGETWWLSIPVRDAWNRKGTREGPELWRYHWARLHALNIWCQYGAKPQSRDRCDIGPRGRLGPCRSRVGEVLLLADKWLKVQTICRVWKDQVWYPDADPSHEIVVSACGVGLIDIRIRPAARAPSENYPTLPKRVSPFLHHPRTTSLLFIIQTAKE